MHNAHKLGYSSAPLDQNQVDLALSDLGVAIQLSGGQDKVTELAYTQRGLI